MRNGLFRLLILIVFSAGLAHLSAGQNQPVKPEKEQLKAHQKAARRLFSTQERNTNKALKQAHIPSAERAQVKHQMKREQHELRYHQRQERQDLKDRRNVIKERAGSS